MDPQVRNAVSSIGVAAAGSVAAWAASHGLVTANDQPALANILVTAAGAGAAAIIGWWESRQHTQPALMKAVNTADNGVSVVSTAQAKAAGIPPVNLPLKK